MAPEWVNNDGGRKLAGFKGKAGDCGCRALAIACQMEYRDAYELINRHAKTERKRRKQSSARTGVHSELMREILAELGWRWVPTMGIGTGCRMRVRPDELPPGRLILRLSKHFAAVVDGVLHDTYDSSRNGTRCVYGYWTDAPAPVE